MSKRSSCWYSMIVQGPPKERGSQSCRGCSSHLWSDVAFDHWSTQKCNRVLRRAYQMTGRQECLPVIAQPRRDEDRARILVLPRSSALLHWPIPPLWGSWIFEEFPVHRSLDPVAQHVHGRSGVDYESSLFRLCRRGCWHYARLRQESRVYLVPPVWVCGPPLASPIRLCGRVALVLEFRLAFFPRIWEPTEVAPEVHIFAWLPAMDPFLSRIVAWPSWSWRTWLRDLIPIFRPQKRLFWRPPWDTHPNWIFSVNEATLYWAAHQPQCVWNVHCQHTRIRIQTWNWGIREGARSHTTVPCTFLSENLYRVSFFQSWRTCSSWTAIFTRLLSVSLGRRSQNRRGWLCSWTGIGSVSVIASVSRGSPVSETTRVSPWTLSSYFPLKAFSHCSFRADVSSFVTLVQRSRLKSFIPGL